MSNAITSKDGKREAKSAKARAIRTGEDVNFYCDGLSRAYVWGRDGLYIRAMSPDGAVIHERKVSAR